MDSAEVALLDTPEAAALLSELTPYQPSDDIVRLVGTLRSRGISENLTRAVLRQRRLRAKAIPKFADRAAVMWFTDDGLQQATRRDVAAVHAARFTALGSPHIADLGCGIGGDTLAFAENGLRVTAIDRDEVTARIAAHNLSPFPDARVIQQEVVETDLSAFDALWFDPARRSAGKRLTNPDDWSPPLDWVFATAGSVPSGIKLSPAIPHELLPEGCEAQWIQDGQDTVECVVWTGTLARPGIVRSALVLRDGVHELAASAADPDVPLGSLATYIYDPGGAVIRAELLGALARELSATTLAPGIAYLTSDIETHTPFADCFRVHTVLPLDTRTIATYCRNENIGVLEIKKRGVDIDPASFRTGLKLKGTRAATLILTRMGTGRVAVIAERVDYR